MSKFFSVYMAIVFIVSVVVYSDGTRFSSEMYLQGISEAVEEVPDIQGLLDIWDGGMNGPVDSDADFYEKAVAFFENIGSFFENLWDSILYIVDMLLAIFAIIPKFLPWRAVVPIE